jgi:hypothetical protein
MLPHVASSAAAVPLHLPPQRSPSTSCERHNSEREHDSTGRGPSDCKALSLADHPNLHLTYANAAKKQKIDFKVPLPIPEWKDLELRSFKTSHCQVPLNHQEFYSVREKLYQYILNYLKNNPEPKNAHHTEASHNH